jgi:hypothetical protein
MLTIFYNCLINYSIRWQSQVFQHCCDGVKLPEKIIFRWDVAIFQFSLYRGIHTTFGQQGHSLARTNAKQS